MSKSVTHVRQEVAKLAIDWKMIRACIEGERAIKALGDDVLPRPNAADTSPENSKRYDAYLKRAVFYNVTGRTLGGLVGYVFSKEPLVTLPDTMKVLEEDVDGGGTTLHQQAKRSLGAVLAFGRCGLFVDYPPVESGAATRKDLMDGAVRPTICFYEPDQIINWRIATKGAKSFLSLLVLQERYAKTEDEFDDEMADRFRVLDIDDAGYRVRLFDDAGVQIGTEFRPKGSDGNPLREVPFVFIGSETNDASVDHAPIKDLAFLNLAHFRNSADYEEASFLVGQPTPWLSGLTEQWVEQVMKGKISLGSRGAILLPVGGQAGLLQATANTMPKEAMEHKERQMVALGAKLVEQKDVQRTATEAGLEHASEASILVSAANNVFSAYRAALAFCGQFVGTAEAAIEYDLAEPLVLASMTPEQANAVIALLQGGLIDFEEARYTVKKAGLAWKEDDEVKDNNLADGFATPPVDPNAPPPADPNAPPAKP